MKCHAARLSVGGLWSLLVLCAAPVAQGQAVPEELLIKGFSWDLQLEAGAGLGLDRELDQALVGRVRVGALLADEPVILNLGVTGELGGLASRGVGAAFEFNHFGGGWARAGLCYARGPDWMTRLSVGFALFSIEWQQRLGGRWEPDSALMFQVRLPVGIWWIVSSQS